MNHSLSGRVVLAGQSPAPMSTAEDLRRFYEYVRGLNAPVAVGRLIAVRIVEAERARLSELYAAALRGEAVGGMTVEQIGALLDSHVEALRFLQSHAMLDRIIRVPGTNPASGLTNVFNPNQLRGAGGRFIRLEEFPFNQGQPGAPTGEVPIRGALVPYNAARSALLPLTPRVIPLPGSPPLGLPYVPVNPLGGAGVPGALRGPIIPRRIGAVHHLVEVLALEPLPALPSSSGSGLVCSAGD